MGWGNLESAANSASGNGGRYLKVRDGNRFELLLLSEPFTMQKTWNDGRTSTRFAAVVYVTSDPAGAQQFEFGPGIAKDLASELKGQDARAVKVMISRKGSGQTDTRYTVARLGAATPAELAAAKVADEDRIWDLEEDGWCPLEQSSAPSKPPAGNNVQDSDVPFD